MLDPGATLYAEKYFINPTNWFVGLQEASKNDPSVAVDQVGT